MLEAEKGRLDYLNHWPRTNKNVLWLHVTVDNTVRMQVMQCFHLGVWEVWTLVLLNHKRRNLNVVTRAKLAKCVTSCLAIAWTCSSGRHLSSSRTSNSSPYERCSIMISIFIYNSLRSHREEEKIYLGKLSDNTELSCVFKGVEHFNNVLMLELPQYLKITH